MQFIYKKKDITILRHFADNIFDSLFKFAPVFRPRYHAGKVQHYNSHISDRFRNNTQSNSLCQPFHDGRLPYARFPNKAGVILRTPAQDLNDPRDLRLSAHDRIKSVLGSDLSQIPAVSIQCRRSAFIIRADLPAEYILFSELVFAPHSDECVCVELAQIDPHGVKKSCRNTIRVTEQSEQYVLCPRFIRIKFSCNAL